MSDFTKWRTSLALIDLLFAESVLKKLSSSCEEHAALLAVLFALSRHGHLVLDTSSEGVIFSLKLLEVEDVDSLATLVQKGAETLPPNPWIHRCHNHFYLQKNWAYESEILAHLERLKKSSPLIPLSGWTPDPRLNDAQRGAVEKGMQNALSLLTGGPGTGKTFTAAEFVKACLSSLPTGEKSHYRIILAAPTGKAVAGLEGNLRRAIGREAQVRTGTLHSILGITPHQRENEATPLFADLVIIDECSMIDAKIFAKLLAAATSGLRLILIGDKDQLPPVEAGSIFADLVDAGIFPVTHLTQSLRSDRTEILSLAKCIREGRAEEALSFLSRSPDLEWIDLEEGKKSVAQLYAHLWESCKDKFPSSFLEKPSPEQIVDKLGEFSILSCMRKGPLGVDAVNGYFLNQSLRQTATGTWWAAPIMVTRNDHELQLFNGDLGFVVRHISPDFSLRQFHGGDYVLFCNPSGGFRQIPALALNAFEYSYCLSVHKSQGSEYDEVFILVPNGSESFGREVLYTAVTRARRKVSLAGSKEILSQSIVASSRKTSGIHQAIASNFF